MWKKVILIVVLMTWLSSSTAAKTTKNRNSGSSHYAATSFDYDDYVIEPRRRATTTERPIVRYWNSFVRNLPIPPIPWNMTNTLTNLFNQGASNVIETPVSNYQTKRKSSRKRKTSAQGSKNRRRPQDNYDEEEGHQTNLRPQQPNMLLGSIPTGMGADKAMYFYDPNSNQYFEVKRLRLGGQYDQENLYNGVGPGVEADNYDAVEEPEEMVPQIQMAEDVESDAMHLDEMPVMDNENAEDVNEEDDRKSGGAVEMISENKSKKTEEKMRNAIGSYMQDDRFTRTRQRATTKLKASKEKLSPRDNFRYYYLHGW